MGLSLIDTGYKPEGALGALYQGENAGMQEQNNQLSLIKDFLANRREQQMQPLDIAIRGKEAAQANALNTPELLQRFAAGQGGVWDSQTAKGKEDTALVDSNIDTKKAANLFNMQDSRTKQEFSGAEQDVAKLTKSMAKYKMAQALGQGTGAIPYVLKDLGLDPNDPQYSQLLNNPEAFQGFLDQTLSGLKGVGASSAANNQAQTLKKMDNDTSLATHELQSLTQLEVARIHAAAQRDVASHKNSTEKLNEQYARHLDTISNPNVTPQERAFAQSWINEYRSTKLMSNPAAFNPQIDITELTKGKVPTRPSPVEQVNKPTVSPAAQSLGLGPQVDQNQQALEWLKANPNHPKAEAVRKKLGL